MNKKCCFSAIGLRFFALYSLCLCGSNFLRFLGVFVVKKLTFEQVVQLVRTGK